MTCFGTSVIYAQNNTPVSFDGQQDSHYIAPIITKIEQRETCGRL